MGRCFAAAHRRFWAAVGLRRRPASTLVVVLVFGLAAAACTDSSATAGEQSAIQGPTGSHSSDGDSSDGESSDGESGNDDRDDGDGQTHGDRAAARAEAANRSVVVQTSGCGDAGRALGSGVALADGRVLTVAHVVAGATEVTVIPQADYQADPPGRGATGGESADDESVSATIVAYDPLRDLALLEAAPGSPPLTSSPPTFEVLGSEDMGTIIGAATSGDVDFAVTLKTIIEMDEVRGTRRSKRSGYLLQAATASGDSGAGLYGPDGQLVGLLFAVSTEDGNRSWATAADEIERFLADESVTGRFGCNPERSKLERTEPGSN